MGFILTIVHIVTCLFLIVVVLLQSSKSADLAGAFGGMGSQTAFGPRGAATILTKATTIGFVLFVFTSITLGIYRTSTAGSGESVVEQTGVVDTSAEETVPVAPTAPAGPVPGQNLGEFTLSPEEAEGGVMNVDVGEKLKQQQQQQQSGETAPAEGEKP